MMRILFIMFMLVAGCGHKDRSSDETQPYPFPPDNPGEPKEMVIMQKLHVEGPYLVGANGQKVQLKGVSSHGLQWYGKYVSYESLRDLRDKWGISVFRAAMYTAEGGYLSNPEVKLKVYEAVNAAIELGIYVIVDWHILSDGNPLQNKEAAKVFFKEVATKYKGIPNVLYEIANEPNGVTWNSAIKKYAEEVIPVIRAVDPEAVVIVGTGTYSQDIHEAIANPLKADNVMYTLHFYAASHGDYLRNRLRDAHGKGFAIFITEWGSMNYYGKGPLDYESTRQWLELAKELKVGWAVWALADSSDSCGLLKPGAPVNDWQDKDISESGWLVRRYL